MRSELLAFLASIGASPRKSLSQNFLIDPVVIQQIVSLAEIKPSDWVLEIGPGAGAITEAILAKGAHVFAVEKDPLFAQHLSRLQTSDHRLHVACADFLEFPLDTLQKLSNQWKVVSNLPYQVTAPILELLCEHGLEFESATILVQKEVGDRIAAKPCTKNMGSLTIFLQFYAELAGSFPISANSFYPKPSVESMALRLNFKHAKPPVDPKLFFPIVRKAYQQRRKMLTTSLRNVCPNLGGILAAAGLSSKSRPEELALEDWVAVVSRIITLR